MDILKIYQDFGILTPDSSNKHFRPGWVNCSCPFCHKGVDGFHLGFNTQHNYFTCWSCGHKGPAQALSKVLGVNYRKANEIIKSYKGTPGRRLKTSDVPAISVKKKTFRLPNHRGIWASTHAIKYMRKRGFNTNQIEILMRGFQIKATGPVSFVKTKDSQMDLKFRILAPIFFEGEMVSYQTRDCTDKSTLKYLTCPGEIEKMDHKKLIYFHPSRWDDLPDTLILTEGIFDVWKIFLTGYFAGCGFGVELTIDQVHWIKANFKRVIFFMDSDNAGKKKAKYLYNQLGFAGVSCFTLSPPLGEDPGSMSLDEIDNTLKWIVFKHIK